LLPTRGRPGNATGPRERWPPGLALFAAFAAAEKTLHANPGRHVAIPAFEMESSERFFLRHLAAT
jgi:hypothetical protein